jgi:phage/plasmid-associated DNA primase
MADTFLEEHKDDIVYNNKLGYGFFYRPRDALWQRFESFDSLSASIKDTIDELGQAKDIRNVTHVVRIRVMLREDDLSRFDMTKGVLALRDKTIFNMKTKQVRERTKYDYCSYASNYYYDTDYDKTWVLEYIRSLVCVGDTQDDYKVLQVLEILGYAFTNENNLKLVILMLGEGDNGKSALIREVKNAMGQAGVSCPKKVVIRDKFNSDTHQAHLWPLIGKRSAFISELKPTDEYNTETIKASSGGDPQSIRNSGGSITMDVVLTAVLFVITNHSAKYNSKEDPAFGNRIVGLNFPNRFERLASKDDEIREHSNDIFCAMMDGANRYYIADRKIHLVDSIKNYTQSIADSKDPFIQFTRNITHEINETRIEPCHHVYYSYTEFTRKSGNASEGKENFYSRFEQKYGIVKYKNHDGYYYKIQQVE